MSLRANLARNLRRMCSDGRSVKAICEEMGINRNQFDKYLNALAIPSKSSLAKICRYFGVTEEDLFEPENNSQAAPKRAPNKQDTIGDACTEVMSPLWTEGAASIKPGIYFLWVTVPKDPNRIVCAPIFIARKDEALTFRRIVGAAESKDRFWFHRVGDHKGLIVERLNWIMLIGVNQRGTFEPSMMRLRWTSLSQPTLSGHATITTESGVSFAALCMRPAPPSVTFRKAIRQSRSFDREDPAIDAAVRMVLDQERRYLSETLDGDLAISS